MQVMLSYSREQREEVTEIYQFLQEKGLHVWFDQTHMTGDIMDAMAKAVESSDVICICYSKDYYQSENCESEAKYAKKIKKRRIFIKMREYEPEGWLGIMLGTAIFVDYTGKKDKAAMREKLLDEILERKKGQQKVKLEQTNKGYASTVAMESDERSLVHSVKICKVSPSMLTLPHTKSPKSDGGIVSKKEGRIQVMLSYHSSDRERVKDISMFLKQNGFRVWFDTNDMAGDTYRAMADAIEESDVICICFSKAYTYSEKCRMEAEYANTLDKPLLPLKMENYNPRGWLGFIIAPLLYVDFTGKYPEEEQKVKLLRELENKQKEQQDSSDDD